MSKFSLGGYSINLPSDSKAALALSKLNVPKREKCLCGQTAIYVRKQEGRYYCRDCFLHQFERRFKRNIRKYGLLEKGDNVAVALSGGKDSSILLSMLAELAKPMQLKVTAITIDEGIGKYRSETIGAAKALCKRLKIPLQIASFKKEFGFNLDQIPKKLGGEIQWCSWCGVLRRRALNSVAKKLGAAKLAVSHNLDDEAQAIMLGMIRGDFGQFRRLGFAPGLAKSDKWVPRIKPLRDAPETETTLYAILNNIPFSSSRCPHSKEILRHKVRLFLNDLEHAHPGVKHQIIRFYDRLQPSLTGKPGEVMQCSSCGEPSSGKECRVCDLLKQLKQ